MIDPYVAEWLGLLGRWFHLTMGIAWIGASFYFVWLNNAVRPPEEPAAGVAGDLWAVHGGAFYQVQKYGGVPPYATTQFYVKAVLKHYDKYRQLESTTAAR